MEARESSLSFLLRMVVAEKLDSVETELEKMKEKNYSLRVGLQWMQKKLELVRGALKQKGILVESLREAARERKHGRGGRKGGRKK